MRKVVSATLSALLLGICVPADASSRDGQPVPSLSGHASSRPFRGIRFALAPDNLHRVDGVNVSLWERGDLYSVHARGVYLGLTRVWARSLKGMGGALIGLDAGDLSGIGLGGLTLAGGRLRGLQIGGLGTGGGMLTGISVGGLGVWADSIRGIAVGGLAMGGGDVSGLGIGGAGMVCRRLRGLGAGAYCQVQDDQSGVTLGLLNLSGRLHGVQFGLLNYAGNNPRLLRILPLVNAHFGR